MIPNPDLVKRVDDLQIKIREVYGKMAQNRKEREAKQDKIKKFENEIKTISMPDVKAADLKIRIY